MKKIVQKCRQPIGRWISPIVLSFHLQAKNALELCIFLILNGILVYVGKLVHFRFHGPETPPPPPPPVIAVIFHSDDWVLVNSITMYFSWDYSALANITGWTFSWLALKLKVRSISEWQITWIIVRAMVLYDYKCYTFAPFFDRFDVV